MGSLERQLKRNRLRKDGYIWSCDLCKKGTLTRTEFLDHMRSIHPSVYGLADKMAEPILRGKEREDEQGTSKGS